MTLPPESGNRSAWKGPLWSSAPTSLPRQIIPEHRITSRQFLNLSSGGDSNNISGQPVPVPSHSHRKVLPHVQVEFPVHHFLLLASCPISWQHQEEPCKSSAHFHEVMTSWEHVRNALLLGHFPQECHSQGRAAMRTNSTPGATLRLVSTVHVQEWGHHAAQDQQPWKSQPRTAGNGWGQRSHN